MRLFPQYDGPPLIEQIVSVPNLTLAWQRVRSNIRLTQRGRSAGTDAVTLRDFEADWARQMTQLADDLRHGSYRPLPPKRVTIPKASGGARAIAILAVRDRVAQRAVQQVLQPLFDPYFLDCAYGCRTGMGVAHALERVQRYADQGLIWVVDADISDYFDTIDQRILLQLVRQRIDEVAVLRLVAQWLASGALGDGEIAPLADVAQGLVGRAKQVVQRTLEQNEEMTSLAVDSLSKDTRPGVGWPTSELSDPVYGPPSWPPRSQGWENKLWTAVMVARPVMRGARSALPYVQRVGGRRLAIAGAVAAGTVAAGEVVMRRWASARGTPQGGALSPLLANIYLHPFDLAVTSHGYRLVRYMDDFVIMSAAESDANRALAFAQRQLGALRLTLHPDKTRVLSYTDGLDFLGEALAPRPKGTPLSAGVKTFVEAEQALRTAARNVKRRFRKS